MTATDWTWLPEPLVRVLHARLINDFGGLHGDGGPGHLDAVLARPLNLVEHEPDVDTYDLAGAYAEALARGHAFTDGNKRIAFTAAMVFLRLNGEPMPERDEAQATERTLALAAGVITRIEYAHWLRG